MRVLHHNTSDEIAAWLAEAWRLVSESDVPESLHPIAFEKALGWLASKQVMVEQSDVGSVAVPHMVIPRNRRH